MTNDQSGILNQVLLWCDENGIEEDVLRDENESLCVKFIRISNLISEGITIDSDVLTDLFNIFERSLTIEDTSLRDTVNACFLEGIVFNSMRNPHNRENIYNLLGPKMKILWDEIELS